MSRKMYTILKDLPLFKHLSDQEIESIALTSKKKTVKRGEHIFFQGEKHEAVYFIDEGTIKIYRNDIQGREQIVAVLKSGDMFPHIGFFQKSEYPANSIAMEQTDLIYILLSEFEKVLLEQPETAVKLYRMMGEKISELQQRLEAQILNDTYEKFIKWLLRFGNSYGKETEDGMVSVMIPLTNKEIAQMIGTTRETVSRILTKMKNHNLVHSDKKNKYIYDPESLTNELIKEKE
ncbi:CRP/FNR family transcriptional regulator [Oikeobacillus pervagus]|uniref:CRP/FNR family transcriptional regulator n=1 Tax=Oikeobacillus pervagus TaxID=1325931 RepID=A0AAJ1WKE6_9BACI|nr:Crp/Fnr family transcriptional regulator [Oikeobacillus pervagus]MDQ0216438.1 CRP/FNR family transcriptional regulator [Oikeobacillus pervagus]